MLPSNPNPYTEQSTDYMRNRTPRPYKRVPAPSPAEAYAEYTFLMYVAEAPSSPEEPRK